MTGAGGFRLSPQQRRLWQLQSRLGERPFRARALAHVDGRLDLGLLREAVEQVAGQFEILRTTFPCPAGLTLPVQRVSDQAAAAWQETRDLSGLTAAEREAALEELLLEVEEEPFDFARGPLLRLAPAVLSEDEHALVLVLPALCADAVTLRNLVHRIAASYAVLSGEAEEPEGSDPLQYVDLAEWQNELLEDEETAAGREHWEAWDPTVCRALRLPFETSRTEEESRFEPRSLSVPLDHDLARRAAALAGELGASLPMLLLAAWQSLLWRLLGQPEIVVGMAAECRSYEGLSESLGPLASFIPLSCRLDGDLRFADAVTRARDEAQDAAEWQEYFRWESVAERHALALEETVFPVSFTAQDQPAPWRAGLLEWTLPRFEAGIDRFRLGLAVRVEDGLPAVDLIWDAALFSRDDAESLAGAWQALLAFAVARPETRLGELALTGSNERTHLAPAEPGTAAAPALIHELFARQARRVPDRAAVASAGTSLSYAELAKRASLLARRLRCYGVGPDVLVALCLERSLAMPLAVLGVLEAGGAYLPLEPGLPRERKTFLLNDAEPRVILTETRFLPDLPADGIPVLCLDGPWEEEIPEAGSEPAGPAPDPANLAYVIYTSGSTGAPKGVAVEHRQLANYVRGVAERLDLPDGAAYAMVSTFAADLGNTVLFPSLCGGGTLHLIPDALTSDPVALAAALERDPVDCMKITPSHLEALLSGAPGARLLPRRCLVLGGEASRREWVEGLMALQPGLRVINHYGPTETTVGILTHPAGSGLRTATLPLGRSLPGTTAWLLGPDLAPLPAWFPGELYLGGSGVARGYLGRPGLTADRFVPDPLAEVPGVRMYRTGDLARRLPDGTYEFIGRADNQVKVRGFRIELGEIETVLESDPEVRRAAVAARDDGSGSRRLVAYVVAGSGSAASATALRERLHERLPEFMIPSAFVFLGALPLNANGKVDRRALPEPDWRHLGAAEDFVAPETPTEELLARVWSEVLGVERVGAHDNFFHLGGDSIRGIVVRARAEEQGVAFSIEQLFDHPVLRDLARVAGEGDTTEPGPARTEPFGLLTADDRARLPEGVEDAYPLATLQAGMLFHSEVGEGTAIFHDLHSVHVKAPFDSGWMGEAVRQVSLLHPLLRTSFDLASYSESLQLVHAGVSVPLEIHDLRPVPPHAQEAAVSDWLRQERERAFDWAQPPLLAFYVHLRSAESFQFTLSFHHTVLDGWSAASLLTEVFHRYFQLLRGEAPLSMAPLASSYRDFVALERAAIASPEARSFWSRMLDEAEAARLPRLSARETAPGTEAGIRTVQPPLDPALTDAAQQAAREAEVPLKSLLLAVFLRALGALAGSPDVLTALISHGRPEHADGERVLGLFLNTVPFRMRLGSGSWRDLAREVFDLERRMLPFRRFPFAEMQRMQGDRLELDVAFNYLHYHVYQGAVEEQEIEILGGQNYEETDFPLLAYLSLNPVSQRLQLRLTYHTRELEAREVERFADYLLRALAAVATDSGSRYDAPLFSAAERHQLLAEWNDSAAEVPGESLLARIEEQRRRTPDALAVAFETERLTYAGIVARVDRLAYRLRQSGCGPESRVGVALERTPDLLVALLGVLKAGAVYVPLDPEYPRERLAYLLENSQPVALVTQEHLQDRLPLPGGLPVLIPEADGATHPGAPENLGDHQLAYIIYTSGSTGRPKGAMVAHGGMINHLEAKVVDLGLDEHSRVAQTASPCFDISVWQLLAALLAGGSVHIADELTVHDPELLLRFVAREGITVLEVVPSLLSGIIESLAAAGDTIDLSTLQWMIVTGEACPQSLADRWLTLAPHTRLLNAYGPTECSDDVTHYTRTRPGGGISPFLPIGTPVANTRLYVLDPRGIPTPQGVPGEICVTGWGVGRGYLDLPERTAQVFVPDAWSGEPGSRLYRTGDLGRWLPDGTLDFLGRLDRQVKVRGFRIELGEIEAALTAQPGVREAVVLAREDRPGMGPGDLRLVAYVTGEAAADPGAEGALRRALGERLPEYMVPAAFVMLDALPLTPNGKVDREALPAPEWQRAEEGYRAPRTPVEEVLAGIWAELLDLTRVGATDNFFDLGGHSLLATRVMSRLRSAFGVEMPLRALFEAPSLASLAIRVEEALRAGAAQLTPPLVPTPREGALPLSFAQQRLWFIDQLEPGSPLYNLPMALRVEGPLDSRVLALSLGEIMRRHESLRTVFATREGAPVQVVRPAEPFRLPLLDLSGLPEEKREAMALALTGEEAARPFDLGRGPLLRGVLLRLAGEDHIAALTMHHIASDGWSIGILVREVAALYAAFAQGRPSPLPELPVQYADFAAWQTSWLQGEALEAEISYWRQQLAGLPPQLELPTDRPRPAVQSYRGATRPVRLPAGLISQAQALSRREGATLFMVLLAGFQALLTRYSGQRDLAVGSPVAGRNRIETEDLIGFFVNALVLRGDLTGEPSLRELLGRVRETALAAHTHQDVPFEKLVQELSPERSLAHTPLFQVVLALQNAPVGALELRNLRLRPLSSSAITAKFDLTLNLTEHGGGISGIAEYATDLFDAATVDRLVVQYERLLTAILAEPERRIGELPLLPAAERHQVLVEWNDTAVARGEETRALLIQEPFEAWARRTPEAVATVWKGETLTYAALEERANRLAAHLVESCAGPGSLIGIHLRRGPGLVVAVLAVLKAGAAYVPLEIGHPLARLRYIVETLEISILITETAQQESLPSVPHVICLDRPEWAEGAGPAAPRPARRASPDDLAYIIFTSGSTGTPKGVMVRHRPVINLLRWAYRAFAFSPEDRVLFVTSLSFDLSVFDIFGLLGAGGSIRIASEEEIREPERLLQALAEEPITFWDSAPAALEQTVPFLAGIDAQAHPALRLVFLSGDWIPVTLPDRIRERFPEARVISLGGATEATVWSNVFPIGRVEPSWTSIPYGRPIENARYHVLDSRLDPCPVGVPGDLYIGGDCLADGYAQEPVLTAHKFLPDPWSSTQGGRLYRTGDRARYRPDGNLEFLGRLDHQVKIRGFRIELGEIETALATMPGVREAAVVVREDRSEGGDRDRRLVAYVAGDASADTLRRSLRERLPDYMVPAAVVTLAALPLTPNGKVDRKALPAPEQPSTRESYVAPRTREEEILAAVWAQVLRLSRVGVTENFFELGGDSILSVQIVARARQAGLLFTVRQIFEHQTVAELARHATAADTVGAARAGQGPVEGEVPLTPIQRWFFEQGLADPHHFNQALVLEAREPLAPAALERAMAALVEHHDALRLRFDFEDGWRQENAAAEPVAPFCQVDLSGLPESRLREVFELAAPALQAGFDLTAGPLTRLTLFEAGAGQPARLLWVSHHLVVDGVSWRVLLEDLEGAYRQAADGLRPALPPKTTSFKEWARRLAGHAGSDALASELDYWLEEARTPVPPLPVDFPSGGENTVDAEAAVFFELAPKETSDLLQTVPSVYHNRIDEALLSALARALAEWAGSPRLRLDLEGHGREPMFGEGADLDVSRTVGWFTTMYPVVLEAGDAGPGHALVSAKERLRAVPNRGIGYGLLRYLEGAGDGEAARLLAAAPAAEITFNYLGQLNATSDERPLFRASIGSAGPTRSPRARRTHLLDVGGKVADGRLQITLVYGSRVHRRETIERLAAAYAGALRQLIRDSRAGEEVFTPSDFPSARLDARGFNRLASLLGDPVEPVAGGLGLTLKNVEDVYPLSPLQNGMLFHSLMTPESGVYVNQVTCTLPEDLDVRRFRQAWETLVERHEVLRAAFVWDSLDEARQVVRRSCPLPWQDLDWRDLPADEQQRRFEELRYRERHTPLSLDQAPLMRFSLVHLGRELGFIWTFHHILMDGWSLPVLVQELGTVYAALREGREPGLPPARPFSDYIAWLQKQDPAEAEPFWRRELSGFAAPNPLGVDRPAGIAGASGFAEQRTWVSGEILAELQALAARHKLTLQTVTLGAWAVLVSRYSSEEDVVFGGVVSGRPAALPGVERMVGMFVNTLPVRVRVDEGEALGPWLQRLQERQLARQDFEHTPLTQIQRWSEVPFGSPLFETLYVFENYPVTGDSSPGGLRIGNLRSFEATNYPLTLALTATDRITLQLAYDRGRMDDGVAPRLLRHLATLLAGMAERPESLLQDLPLLDPEEHRQVVLAGNATARARAGEELSLHGLFERQAALSPEAPAVVGDDGVVSYGELASWAGRIAERLRRLGVGAEDRVGLCLERSAAALAAMLGALQAGATYVPLDPEWPRERLAAVEADAGLAAMLTRSDLAAASGLAPREVLVEEARRGAPAEVAAARPVTPEAAAYVIYTSGSTGVPKGVVVPHRAAANFVLALGETLDLGPGDRLLLFAPLSFDASVLQIFPVLSRGAAVVVHPDPRELAGTGLPGFCERHGVTVLDLPAALWRQWIEDMATAGQALPAGIRAFLTGGESVPAARVRAWAGLTRRPATFLSSYGPTEATVTSTVFLTDSVASSSLPEGKVPIGRPLANVRAYVLDARMRPVPAGVPGELYLTGDGLARGYLGQPGLTAASFVPDPVGDAPGGRLYRTGDLARRLPGEELEFLGRADTQVKIRGFRLELSEVEAALRQHPDLAECVVTVREDRAEDRRLVAYVVPQPGREPGVPELRSFVAERLPQFMVPSAIVTLSTLPVLASGKVDRAALPVPDPQRAEGDWLAPRTPAEETLAGIWAELLGVPRVGADDHFFDLGGHSLLATQARSRVREAFGVELPLRTLFERPLLADLAAEIEALQSADGTLGMTIERADRQGPLPLSWNQQRFWFLQQLNPASSAFNLTSAVRLSGGLDAAALEASFGEIVRRHSALRIRTLTVAGVPHQIVVAPGAFVLPRVDLSGLGAGARERELRRVTESAAGRPFDLEEEPPLQALLVRLAEADHALFFSLHHIASDGWSMELLTREAGDLYAAFSEGRPSPLPELPIQYGDWVAAQQEWLRGPGGAEQLAYWRRQLGGDLPVLTFPMQRQRPRVRRFRGAAEPLILDASLSAALVDLCRSTGSTLFMGLLAAFKALLHLVTGAEDLLVGTNVANREWPGTEGLIGLFVNDLALRTDLSGRPGFRELLVRVRETALEAYAHQDLPFEALQADLRPERSAGPLFQVLFTLQNAPAEVRELPGLTLAPLPAERRTANFDLTLSLAEGVDGLRGAFVYDVDLFDAPTIAGLAEHFTVLLREVVSDPDRPLSSLSFASPAAVREMAGFFSEDL